MNNSIIDAANTARCNVLSAISKSGGNAEVVAEAKAEQDKILGFKTMMEAMLKG